MNKQELCKWLEQEAGHIVTIRPDYIVLTDALSESTIDKILRLKSIQTDQMLVVIDHDTPNSSVDVGRCQRKLIDFSIKKNIPVEVCRGISYIRLLESYCKEGHIIVGTGTHLSCFGAIGALGINATEEEILSCVETGVLTITLPSIRKIRLCGMLQNGISWQDAGIALVHEFYKNRGALIFLMGMEKYSINNYFEVCHWAHQGGAWSSIVCADDASGREFDLSNITPQVMFPNEYTSSPISDIEHISVQEVFIGGCRGGKLDDLRIAASILKGKKIAYRLRMVVSPASSAIYIQALQEGLIDIFLDSGAIVMNQGCSVCWGKAQGILDAGEVLVSTGSYNCKGCSGSEDSFVYLVSPAIAAKVAINGYLGMKR
jgi:3-isopropylmalate/(R)-2-methylmalate dehydratase large subunit